MISILFAAGLYALSTPSSGATCYGSPIPVGTGNVPLDNNVSHSVTNTWVFLDSKRMPVAWIYKNGSREYYVQLSSRISAQVAKSWNLSPSFLKRPYNGSNYIPSPVSSQSLFPLATAFLARGYRLVGCFTDDFTLRR